MNIELKKTNNIKEVFSNKKNTEHWIQETKVKLNNNFEIPDEIREKYGRSVAKIRKGEEELSEVIVYLIKNDKWK